MIQFIVRFSVVSVVEINCVFIYIVYASSGFAVTACCPAD
jgi:hypothetical protein